MNDILSNLYIRIIQTTTHLLFVMAYWHTFENACPKHEPSNDSSNLSYYKIQQNSEHLHKSTSWTFHPLYKQLFFLVKVNYLFSSSCNLGAIIMLLVNHFKEVNSNKLCILVARNKVCNHSKGVMHSFWHPQIECIGGKHIIGQWRLHIHGHGLFYQSRYYNIYSNNLPRHGKITQRNNLYDTSRAIWIQQSS
jgi:hypothetical protein